MKFKVISTLSVASLALAFSACGGAANTNSNLVNKTANATNIAVNAAGNTVNAVSNAVSPNTNSNSTASTGDVLKIDEAGIMMTVPKGFKSIKDGEDTVVKSEDEGVDIRFTVPKDGDYEKTVTDAAKEIDDYLDDVKVEDKGSKVDVNGMEGTSMSGTAKNEGADVLWDLTIIKTPKKPVLVNSYADKASMEKHGAEVKAFLNSVKKQ